MSSLPDLSPQLSGRDQQQIRQFQHWVNFDRNSHFRYGTASNPDMRDARQNMQRMDENDDEQDADFIMHQERELPALEVGDTSLQPLARTADDPHRRRRHSALTLDSSMHQLRRFRDGVARPWSRKAAAELRHLSRLHKMRKFIGLEPQPPNEIQIRRAHLGWNSIRYVLREPFAEFFGTFILVLFGDGAVAQVLLSTGQRSAPGGNGFGDYAQICWGFGIGLMLGTYVAGDSGGFLNPAVTFCFCLFRRLPWRMFPVYFLAQFLGGFCAAGVVYAVYRPAIDKYEGGIGIRTVSPSPTATAGIFATYPQSFLTTQSMFISEFTATAILMFVILALKDDQNPGSMGKTGATAAILPLALLFLMFGIAACFGWETGFALNLARDFATRLMTYILGYGSQVWSAANYYFWVPMVAPFVGATFGAVLYDLFIYTGDDSPINRNWLLSDDASGRRRSVGGDTELEYAYSRGARTQYGDREILQRNQSLKSRRKEKRRGEHFETLSEE